MFYKFLSDKTLETFKISARIGQTSEKDLLETYKRAFKDYGKSLITATQVIDDNHILSLIGSKTKNEKGFKTVDNETLRLILYESLAQYNPSKKDSIPYIDELQAVIDFDKAENQEAGNQLAHVMHLLNKVLPEWFFDMNEKYN
jgi:geranylgeranyl pyrophosphate synthase